MGDFGRGDLTGGVGPNRFDGLLLTRLPSRC